MPFKKVKQNRILVLVDGSNFYHRLKTLRVKMSIADIPYRKLFEGMTGSKEVNIFYYIGEIQADPDDKKAQELSQDQQEFLEKLKKQDIRIKLGYMLHNDEQFNEKGVDVQMAVDMVDSSADGLYDEYYLVSSDTDLLPAIQAVQKRNKKVVYVTVRRQISEGLKDQCDDMVTISKKDLHKLVK